MSFRDPRRSPGCPSRVPPSLSSTGNPEEFVKRYVASRAVCRPLVTPPAVFVLIRRVWYPLLSVALLALLLASLASVSGCSLYWKSHGSVNNEGEGVPQFSPGVAPAKTE